LANGRPLRCGRLGAESQHQIILDAGRDRGLWGPIVPEQHRRAESTQEDAQHKSGFYGGISHSSINIGDRRHRYSANPAQLGPSPPLG
jgi:hypothetical protein